MTFDPRKAALPGPAAIAIHDDGDVPRNRFAQRSHELEKESLAPGGTDADHGQLRASEFRDPADVPFSLVRQVGEPFHFFGRTFPAWHLEIDRLATSPLRGIARGDIENLPVEPVSDTNLDRIDLVKSVEVSDRQLIDSINHGRVVTRDRIEPTAASGPPGGGAELTAHFVKHPGDHFIFGRE